MGLEDRIPGTHYSRRQWGAPLLAGGSWRSRSEVEALTVHHTTGNTLGHPDTVRWVYNIYRYHTATRGWADIGYAYLIDRYGNVFTGRGRWRQLAHATGYNRTHLGVAYLGTGREGHVTPEAKRAFVGLREWLREDGGMANMDATNGHRDIGHTSCPGDALYEWAVSRRMALTSREDEIMLARFSSWARSTGRKALELFPGWFTEHTDPRSPMSFEELLVRLDREGLLDALAFLRDQQEVLERLDPPTNAGALATLVEAERRRR